MIKIKQFDGKWRLEINEEWEFDSIRTLIDELETIMEIKQNFGAFKYGKTEK